MKNKLVKLNKHYLILFSLMVFLCPYNSFAASIKISAESSVFAGDTSILNVYLDTEGQVVNSIDGSLTLSDEQNGNFEVQEISLVNSVFTMWPRKPSLEVGNTISFVGGSPEGLSGSRLLLYKVIVKINAPGEFSVVPNETKVYLHDGQGTLIQTNSPVSKIIVGEAKDDVQNKWQEIVSKDNIAPAPFSINLFKDQSLYDGKKFILFETTDSESGISHYEVKEGDYPFVRSGTTYLLIEQDSNKDVVVIAYDKAGNFQTSTLKQKAPINWFGVVVVILLIILIRKIIRRFRRKRNKTNA